MQNKLDTTLVDGPLVSVIVPFFNRMDVVARAIESVRQQTYKNWEIILINDASTEGDADLLMRLGPLTDISYLKLRENVGPAEARNAGLQRARGRFIAFLDSDDTWDKYKLSLQIGLMLKEKWRFTHTSYLRLDTRTGVARSIPSGRKNYVYPWPAFRCLIATPTVVVEREALGSYRFRSDLRYGEDTFLWLALSKVMPLHGIDEPLTTVFTGALTAANNSKIQSEALWRLGQEGLEGLPLHRLAHRLYYVFRSIQRRIFP